MPITALGTLEAWPHLIHCETGFLSIPHRRGKRWARKSRAGLGTQMRLTSQSGTCFLIHIHVTDPHFSLWDGAEKQLKASSHWRATLVLCVLRCNLGNQRMTFLKNPESLSKLKVLLFWKATRRKTNLGSEHLYGFREDTGCAHGRSRLLAKK